MSTLEYESLDEGEALSLSEASAITSAVRCRIVVAGGPAKSGKTTLFAELFQRFLAGPVGEFEFAGSRTLRGWERRLHLSRTASQGMQPDTDRTEYESPDEYLHLRLADMASNGDQTDLLLLDWAGERFREIRDRPSLATDALELGSVDHISVIVDGAALAQSGGRHAARADADRLMQALLDSGAARDCRSSVVYTKWDHVANVGEATLESFLRTFEGTFRSKHEARLQSLSFLKTCARSEFPTALEAGMGLPELLREWMIPRKRPVLVREMDRPAALRPFDRFRIGAR